MLTRLRKVLRPSPVDDGGLVRRTQAQAKKRQNAQFCLDPAVKKFKRGAEPRTRCSPVPAFGLRCRFKNIRQPLFNSIFEPQAEYPCSVILGPSHGFRCSRTKRNGRFSLHFLFVVLCSASAFGCPLNQRGQLKARARLAIFFSPPAIPRPGRPSAVGMTARFSLA